MWGGRTRRGEAPKPAGLALLLLVPLIATAALPGAAPVAADEAGCRTHPPIQIVGDEGPLGFVLGGPSIDGPPRYRPGSGVVGGTGTVEDPYLIQGWCIRVPASPRAMSGISLQDTAAHVVISNNAVSGFAAGLVVEGVANVSVVDNTFAHNTQGMRAVDAYGLQVRDNSFEENRAAATLVRGEAPVVQGNRFATNERALLIQHVVAGLVDMNTFEGNRWVHLALEATEQATVQNNVFVGLGLHEDLGQGDVPPFPDLGILTHATSGDLIHGNRFHRLVFGFEAHSSLAPSLSANHFGSSVVAAVLEGGQDAVVADNLFVDCLNDLVLAAAPGAHVARNRMQSGLALGAASPADLPSAVDGDNLVQGKPLVYLRDVNDTTVPADAGQVIVAGGHNVTVQGQHIEDVSPAIHVLFSESILLQQNDLLGRSGILLQDTHRASIANNSVATISLHGSNANRIAHNDIDHHFGGIFMHASSDVVVRYNDIRNASFAAIIASASAQIVVSYNNIWNVELGPWSSGGHGVLQMSGDPVDARQNWWGCAGGPETDGCAGVHGDVHYRPWATTAVASAGRVAWADRPGDAPR